jgi:hypothetical protein
MEDNYQIEIDALNNMLNLNVSSEVIEEHRRRWMKPQAKAQSGLLFNAEFVKSASEGCVTGETHHEAFQLVLPCQNIAYLYRDDIKTETIFGLLLESPKFIHRICFRDIRIILIYKPNIPNSIVRSTQFSQIS